MLRAIHEDTDRLLATLLPLAIGAGAALFVIAGYQLDARGLCVRRLLGASSVPLDGRERVWQDAEAIKEPITTFGNGGLFAL